MMEQQLATRDASQASAATARAKVDKYTALIKARSSAT